MTTSFLLGKGTKVDIAILPVGSKVEPTPQTLSVGATPVAKDTTSPATITLSAPIAAGKETIPAGTFLGFRNPLNGKVVMVQLTADAEAGDTDLTVDIIPEPIAANSTATYPLRLSGRTNANIGRSGNRVESVDFDSNAYANGLVASIAQTIELGGNYLGSDPGFSSLEWAFRNLREIYYWIEVPKLSDAYSKGKIYKGFASVTDLPLEIPADGIVTASISLAANGEPVIVPDTPV